MPDGHPVSWNLNYSEVTGISGKLILLQYSVSLPGKYGLI